jgi:hypothetical protein
MKARTVKGLGLAGMSLGAALAPAAVSATSASALTAYQNYCGSWNANTQSCLRFVWATDTSTTFPAFQLSAGNANNFSFCGHFELSYMNSSNQWQHDRNSGTVCFPSGTWQGTQVDVRGDFDLVNSSSQLVTLWKECGSDHYFMSNSWT